MVETESATGCINREEYLSLKSKQRKFDLNSVFVFFGVTLFHEIMSTIKSRVRSHSKTTVNKKAPAFAGARYLNFNT